MPGKIVAIEGADATGKRTQSKMLLEKLRAQGFDAALISFPRYETIFGQIVTQYLRGKFGSLKEVKPEFAALLYALDRQAAAPQIGQWLSQGKIVVCDRYVASNIAHQAAKLKGKEQANFIEWLQNVESKLPKPDATVFLDLPVDVSAQLMQSREREKDIHELDLPYLESVRKVYLALCKKENWIKIECENRAGIKPKEEIHAELWKKIQCLI